MLTHLVGSSLLLQLSWSMGHLGHPKGIWITLGGPSSLDQTPPQEEIPHLALGLMPHDATERRISLQSEQWNLGYERGFKAAP